MSISPAYYFVAFRLGIAPFVRQRETREKVSTVHTQNHFNFLVNTDYSHVLLPHEVLMAFIILVHKQLILRP